MGIVQFFRDRKKTQKLLNRIYTAQQVKPSAKITLTFEEEILICDWCYANKRIAIPYLKVAYDEFSHNYFKFITPYGVARLYSDRS